MNMRKHLRLFVYLVVACCFHFASAGVYEDYFEAVGADNDKAVQRLVARGFDVNSVDPKGQPALLLALRDGSEKVAEVLWRSAQLDVDRLNASGESALMMAALRGRVDWMRRLLERGAKPHQDGWSAIHYAATGNQPAAVALMLDRGAPIDARSPNGTTPLMMAARYGVEGSVDLLLARGADATRRNDLQLDAVDFARQAGRDFLVDRLQRAAKR
jgi:ankyrin repeat protein